MPICVSLHLYVFLVLSFFLGGSSLFFRSFVCFVLLKFVFISSVLRSLSNEKEQERKVDLVRWERSGRSRGDHNQNILY